MPRYPVAEGDNRLMVLGTEELEGQGLIVVSGAAFMSNFEVQATISDSNAEKNYPITTFVRIWSSMSTRLWSRTLPRCSNRPRKGLSTPFKVW